MPESHQSLYFGYCNQLMAVGVQAIGAGCSSLADLDLSGCNHVSDVAGQTIGAGYAGTTIIQ